MKAGHLNSLCVGAGAPVLPLIGKCEAIVALRKATAKVAATDAPVLITGETGTGKELVAHQIHAQSSRLRGPFIAVNCAALPASLFQAEVFGYEKGAFTGAYRRNPGRIEAASGGTLFLDEIGDLVPDMQVALLRFLEEKTFERLGSVEPIHADVRVVAATHADLEKACREGGFREDLFHRLNALHLHSPPLRERGGDILRLARHFIGELSCELGMPVRELDEAATRRLAEYPWRGNIRELRNCIRQALVMCEGERLTVADLSLDGAASMLRPGDRRTTVKPLRECRKIAERRAIEQALRHTGGQIAPAASLLGISRAQLYRLIERHAMEADAG